MNRTTAALLCVIALGSASDAEGRTAPGDLIPLAGAHTVTLAYGSVWVTTTRQLLVRIDPATNTVVARIRLPGIASAAAAARGHLWVVTSPIVTSRASSAPSLLTSVDVATNRIAGRPIPLFPMAQGQIVAAGGSLWITNANHGTFGRLLRIDPEQRRLVGAVRIPDDPHSIVVAGGRLWVGEADSGNVVRVDPRTGRIDGAPIAVGGALLTLAAGRGKVWVADSYSGRLVTLDARSARVIDARRLPGVSGIAAGGGSVWTAFFSTREVRAFDAVSGSSARAPLSVRGGVDGIAADGEAVWVISMIGVTRIAP